MILRSLWSSITPRWTPRATIDGFIAWLAVNRRVDHMAMPLEDYQLLVRSAYEIYIGSNLGG